MKKTNPSKDRNFFQPTAVKEAPSIVATNPESKVLKQGKDGVGAGGARKKTGLSSESTAKSYSGKSATKEIEGWKEAKLVPAKTAQKQHRLTSQEKLAIVKPVQPRGQKSEDKLPGAVHNSSSSSSLKSDRSQKALILSKKKKKTKPVASSMDDVSSKEIAGPAATVSSTGLMTRSNEKAEELRRHKQAVTMLDFARKCDHLTIDELTEEFNGLPDPKKDQCKAYLDPKNTDKNRYYNVYCLDKTRVTLRALAPTDGTYIHANFVSYNNMHPFIITQGPLHKSVNDFWRMVWQHRCDYIIMLCQVNEEGRKKTIEYTPSQLGDVEQYGCIQVKTCMRDSEAGLITTRLTLHMNEEQRVVVHYQLTEWRDCRAPVNCVRQLFMVLKAIRSSSQPAVVHCSAGIGRSGSLVALEMLLMDLTHGKDLDVEKVVQILRCQRCHAVQTFEQYISIYKFLLLFGEQNGLIQESDYMRFNQLFDEYTRGKL